MRERKQEYWEVPYLPIDPSDVGREYEPIVRINSQSGKGGVAFIMDTYFGFRLPKEMHKEFSDIIQVMSEKAGEVTPDQIMGAFKEEYIEAKYPLHFLKIDINDISEVDDDNDTKVIVTYEDHGTVKKITGKGNGPIDAVKNGLRTEAGFKTKLTVYSEHALNDGSDSQAATYIQLENEETGEKAFGVGISSSITRSSIRAIFSAANRLLFKNEREEK